MQNETIYITTEDNPYDPFDDWDSWLSFDIFQGYCTCENLARRVGTLPESLTDDENAYFIEQAIDEMVKYGAVNKSGEFVKYKKIRKTID